MHPSLKEKLNRFPKGQTVSIVGFGRYIKARLTEAGEVEVISDEPTPQLDITPRAPTHGVGTELHKLLSKFGLKIDSTCNCRAHISTMNRNGISWCETNQNQILSWLKEEAARRKFPFWSLAAKQLIKLAINQAKQNEPQST